MAVGLCPGCRPCALMRRDLPANAADQAKIGIWVHHQRCRLLLWPTLWASSVTKAFDVSITGFNSAAQMIAPLGTGRARCRRRHGLGGLLQRGRSGRLMKIVADR